MKEITIESKVLETAAKESYDAFVTAVMGAIKTAVDGELTLETMARLNNDQITLWAFGILHEEMMDGGYVQLFNNGYGPFLFDNPFLKILKAWGLRDLAKQLYAARKIFYDNREQLEREYSDEDFMALFEKFPQLDSLDDDFVENEEQYVAQIAYYIDEHLESFVKVI